MTDDVGHNPLVLSFALQVSAGLDKTQAKDKAYELSIQRPILLAYPTLEQAELCVQELRAKTSLCVYLDDARPNLAS